jgi:hypothetical protein
LVIHLDNKVFKFNRLDPSNKAYPVRCNFRKIVVSGAAGSLIIIVGLKVVATCTELTDSAKIAVFFNLLMLQL